MLIVVVVFYLSFFYIKGGALRVNELRLACADRLKCNAHGPTMNLFERLSRVVKVPASHSSIFMLVMQFGVFINHSVFVLLLDKRSHMPMHL